MNLPPNAAEELAGEAMLLMRPPRLGAVVARGGGFDGVWLRPTVEWLAVGCCWLWGFQVLEGGSRMISNTLFTSLSTFESLGVLIYLQLSRVVDNPR